MFQINYRDTRPFYIQIKDSLRQMLVAKAITPDEKLPSIRELATSLAINPNTIQRAYRELETEGYVYTISGKGTFASACTHMDENRSSELLDSFDTLVKELLFLSVSPKELNTRIEQLYKDDNKYD